MLIVSLSITDVFLKTREHTKLSLLFCFAQERKTYELLMDEVNDHKVISGEESNQDSLGGCQIAFALLSKGLSK